MHYTYSIEELADMIRHWINTKPNSYLGQDYGFNLPAMLLGPISESQADFILSELKRHIPPLQNFDSSSLAIYQETFLNDTVKYYIVLSTSSQSIEIELR